MFSTIFFAVSGKTALTLSANGDTALIMTETVVCVLLLSAAVYFKNRRQPGTE